jgi:hypothetical protein
LTQRVLRHMGITFRRRCLRMPKHLSDHR